MGGAHWGQCMHWLGTALSRSLGALRAILRRGTVSREGRSRRGLGKVPPVRGSAACETLALHHAGLGLAPWQFRRGTGALWELHPSGRGRTRQCSERVPRDPRAAATAPEGLPGDQRQRRAKRGTNGIGGIVCVPPINAMGPHGIGGVHVRWFTGVRGRAPRFRCKSEARRAGLPPTARPRVEGGAPFDQGAAMRVRSCESSLTGPARERRADAFGR